jgi:hypothetical protein
MALTSRDITAALRGLLPSPIILSTSFSGRDEACRNTFTVQVPHAAARNASLHPERPGCWHFTGDYLSRHLGTPVTITSVTKANRFTRICLVEGGQ